MDGQRQVSSRSGCWLVVAACFKSPVIERPHCETSVGSRSNKELNELSGPSAGYLQNPCIW